MDAESLARESLPEGVFDSLPEIVQRTMIESQQKLIDNEQKLIDNEQRIQEFEAEAQRREKERIQKQEYEEMQARALERSRQLLRESGMAERVGYDTRPRRIISVEEDHMDISCEFPDNEPNPVSYVGGLIHGFQRSTIDKMVEQAQEILDRADSHKNVLRSAHSYMLFHIWTGNQRVGTSPIIIGDYVREHVDNLYEALDLLLNSIETKAAAYENIYNGNNKNYIHFYFKAKYFPSPNSIDNWGNDIKQIEHKEDFDIFTANNRNVNCIVQVSKRLFNKELISIEDIINCANNNVCIVKPYSGITNIKQINSYKDLVIEPLSPIKSLSVIDPKCIYLLHFNEHLGIIENLKQPKRNVYYTSFRPVNKYPNTQKVTMCFDIECYFDPNNDQKHIPYLCCACFIYDNLPGNVLEFEGKDCIAQMLDHAADTVNDFNLSNIELIAHNGGGYDFHYLLTSMYDPSIVKDIMIRNNHIISFKFKHCGITFNVKDSYNFLCCSLQNAAKAFLGSADKTDFPHHEIRTQEDLQRTFNEWISVDREITVNVEKEKKMIIESTDIINYSTSNKCKKLIDWAKEYCCNDVIVLAKVWIRFKQTVSDVFKCEIVDQTYTLAGMSFRLFEAHLPVYLDTHKGHGNIRLYHPTKEEFINMRKALIGGRCISVNGQYKDIVCLDVKSLYPAAMAYYEQPYGTYRKVTSEIQDELGIFYCKVIPTQIKCSHGFFPLKCNDNVSYSSVQEEYCAWYTSVDMLIGREEGHTITPIPFDDKHVGYSWRHKEKIFKEYIEGVLYKLKLKYEQEGMKEHRWIVKIIMNSLWGKFAQKWMDDKYSIINDHDVDNSYIAQKVFDTDYMIVKTLNNSNQGSKPVQNGIFTLSYARYHMFNIWKSIAKEDAVCVYSDTDSIMINKNEIKMDAIGDKMGELEIEAVFDEFITVGKKQYIGKYGDCYKKRFKGIPLQYISPDLFTHLIKCKDNEAQIKFLKFKREWGMIRGYIENKTVMQT